MPITHKIALIAPVDGLTPLSLVASDVNKKLESVILGTGLDYDSGGNLSILASEINHNILLNYVADQHIDHTTVSISAGTGLTGGGTIASTRTLSLSHLGIESLTDPDADRILFWDDSASAAKWLAVSTGLQISTTNLTTKDSEIVHDNLSGFVADEHVAHSDVSISPGTGMSGGGTIAATRTLNCDITQYTDALARTAVIASSISDGDLTHSPDGNSVFDALALKAPIASPTFTGIVTLPASTLIPDGGTIGQAAGPLVAFDDTLNYLEITGCNVGIGTTVPSAKLHIDQSSTTAAIPVLTLDQADVSEEFIRFIGTAADNVITQSIVAAADVGIATIAGYVKVYVQDDGDQITDQAYYIPIYTLTAP